MCQALYTAVSGIKAAQYGINIVSNNIANINTKGYHKQTTNLGTNVLPNSIGSSPITQSKTSVGVSLINIGRYTSLIEGEYYHNALSEQSYFETRKDVLDSAATLFDEIKGCGLDYAVSKYYEAVNNLDQHPTDEAAKINLEDAKTFLNETINDINNKLDKLESHIKTEELGQNIDGLNNEIQRLAKINSMISTSQTGTLENNNLLDQRDEAMKTLSQYGDFDFDIQKNGSVNVTLSGTKILSGQTVKAEFQQDGSIKTENGSIAPKFNTGAIKGILDGLKDIEQIKQDFAKIPDTIDDKNEFSSQYSAFLGKISSKSAQLNDSMNTQESLVESIENKIQQETGVDMNEELTDLVRFQSGMQASARVFSVCCEVMDTIVNLGR